MFVSIHEAFYMQIRSAIAKLSRNYRGIIIKLNSSPMGNHPNLHKSKMASKYLESLISLLIEVRCK